MPSFTLYELYLLEADPDELTATFVEILPTPAILTWTGVGPSLDLGETATLSFGNTQSLTVTVRGFVNDEEPVLEAADGSWFLAQTLDIGQRSRGGMIQFSEEGSLLCFLAGTLIATPAGEVPVETLAPGDLVLTADGRAVPVRFLGRQTVDTRFSPAWRCHPVRIAAGALAENVPARDLFVSPDHAIVLDGILIFASALTNGTTIRQVPPPAERFVIYSIETERHEVILAEGCPAETFMDHVPRRWWDNYEEYRALYPDEPMIEESPLPHAKSHRQVPAEIHARIAARATALRPLAAA
jgi:hypothetical protein